MFADGNPELHRALAAIRVLLHASLHLKLHEERTLFAPVTQCVPFLAFRVFSGLVRVDGRKLARLRRRVRPREADYSQGRIDDNGLARSVLAMIGHFCQADTRRAREPLVADSLELG